MKPVNLIPADVPVVKANAGKPNLGMIGGAAVGFVAIVGVAAYFAMARVDSVKSETAAATARTAQATQEEAAVRSQIQALGQPIVDSDRDLAQGAEAVLVSAYAERHDFVRLASELRAIMEGTGGWYETIEATSATGLGEGKAVTIVGVMPTKELAASFNERARATKSLANAEAMAIESVRLRDVRSRRDGTYYRFTVTADLKDIVQPSANGDAGVPMADGTGTVVGSGGASGEFKLSLESKPGTVAAPAKPKKPAAPPKPKNPFDIAANAARGAS